MRGLFIVVIFIALSLKLSAAEDPLEGISQDHRNNLMKKAKVWYPTNVASKDILHGPNDKYHFGFNEVIDCDFVDKKYGGLTKKFGCQLPDGEILKVKYGQRNGEVYGEVLASRLLWAIGFGADKNYPVHVRCHGCPPKSDEITLFEAATVERKIMGEKIENKDDSGWSFDELSILDAQYGGASEEEIEALRLLMVFIQHGDNKASNQKIRCLDKEIKFDQNDKALCTTPLMYVHDLGATFGRDTTIIGAINESSKVSLRLWKREKIWRNKRKCIGNLGDLVFLGTFSYPMIKESGRKFLANLLNQLSDQQLYDLFYVSRVEMRNPSAKIEDWVKVFKQKVNEITDHRCPE